MQAKTYFYNHPVLTSFLFMVFLCSVGQGQNNSFKAPSAADSQVIVNDDPLLAELFVADSTPQPGKQTEIKINLQLPADYKAYVDQFKLKAITPPGAKVGAIKLNPDFEFFDKYSKTQRRGVKGKSHLTAVFEYPERLTEQQDQMVLELTYQACTENFCLFPKKKLLSFDLRKPKPNEMAEKSFLQSTFDEAHQKGHLYLFIFIFLAGVLTSLTPCILPMIPITIAILGKGFGSSHSKKDRFINGVIYIFGMAITYSVLGVIVAGSGSLFGSLLNHPAVQIFFALIFILLGLSQFGLFELQTPLGLQGKLHPLGKLPGKTGVLLSGLIAGLIASPCVGPVLVGILTYIAQTQDVFLGFWLMFLYAIGLGQILLILGLSTTLLDRFPRSGRLMKVAKILLGLALISGALFYLSLALPNVSVLKIHKGPLESELGKEVLPWKDYSENLIEQARGEKKPVLIDFYADWCLACHELKYRTFETPEVAEKLTSHFILIKFDATNNSMELEALRKKYGIIGLPWVVFYDKEGKFRTDLTLTQFEDKESFLKRIETLLQ